MMTERHPVMPSQCFPLPSSRLSPEECSQSADMCIGNHDKWGVGVGRCMWSKDRAQERAGGVKGKGKEAL